MECVLTSGAMNHKINTLRYIDRHNVGTRLRVLLHPVLDPEQITGDSLRRQVELSVKFAREHGLILDERLSCKDLSTSRTSAAAASSGSFSTRKTSNDAEYVELEPGQSPILVPRFPLQASMSLDFDSDCRGFGK